VSRTPAESERKWTKPPVSFSMPHEKLEIAGRPAFVMLPAETQSRALPWVWYAPVLPGLPDGMEAWMLRRFLDAGHAVAGIDVGESYGSPTGRATFNDFYDALVAQRGFSPRACLLARSRGALMHYNWATEHPDRVACIAGIYPVCDLRSYPGLANACGAYGLSEQQLAACLAEHNPVDRLRPLAQGRVPIFHIHGDVDTVVPLEANSAAVAEHYRALGGEMTLVVPAGQGHNYWPGFFECQELVDFVSSHAR
jgi:pimeloyl-ACP methyl ester carboxylesterase